MSRFIPRGVAVAGLGKRVVAALVDLLPVAIVVLAWLVVLNFAESTTANFVGGIVAVVLLAAYGLYQWWAYGSRGAGFGAHVMGLRLVGINSGEPIGWWRFFLRQIVFLALMITVVGGIALLVFTVIHERRQGWHDLAARSLLVQPRQQEEKPGKAATRQRAAGNTVGLPPHVASPFAPNASTDHGSWTPDQPDVTRPAWLPSIPPQPSQPSSAPRRAQASPPGVPQPSPSRPGGWIPLPTPSSVIEPPRDLPRVRSRQFGDEADDGDGTHLALPGGAVLPADRPGAEGWYIRLDDGRHVELNVTVLLGRNPQKSDGDPPVHLVPAGGDGRMISRTHVLIGTDARGVYVTDRGSTNGTAAIHSAGRLQPCPIGTQVRVKEGQQVSYGDRWFTVERHPA